MAIIDTTKKDLGSARKITEKEFWNNLLNESLTIQNVNVTFTKDEVRENQLPTDSYTGKLFPEVSGNNYLIAKTYSSRFYTDEAPLYFKLGCSHIYENKILNRKGTYVEYKCKKCQHTYTIDSGD